MLTRFFYRLLALFFYLLALACTVTAVLAAIVAAFGHVEHIATGITAAVFAGMLVDSANRLWRMSRYDPLYDSAGY